MVQRFNWSTKESFAFINLIAARIGTARVNPAGPFFAVITPYSLTQSTPIVLDFHTKHD